MTDSLERIESEFQLFRDKVGQCRNRMGDIREAMGDIRNAYDRLYYTAQRYEHEAKARSLSKTEYAALSKVFEEDMFIISMLKVRGISNHVVMGTVTLYPVDSSPFEITSKSSLVLPHGSAPPLL
jgi:hypothetical protein